jgi:hypothetical protein
VGSADGHLVVWDVAWDIKADGGQFAGESSEFRMLFDPFPGLSLEFVCVGDEAFDATVGAEVLGCSLRADPRDARDVVYAIAHQTEQIDDLFRAIDTEPCTHFGRT